VAAFSRPSLLLQLWNAAHMAERLIASRLEAAGVSDEQFALLARLSVHGPITPTALALEMGVPLTTLSDALGKLDARGEIRRVPNPDDLRSHLVELSARGWKRVKAGDAAVKSAVMAIRKRLELPPDEVECALDDLHDALRAAYAAQLEEELVRKP
jgi:DNA-binding MarR family transcriptional regulator